MKEVEVVIHKKLKVPENWSMFTDEGNRILGQAMCDLVEEFNGEVTAADVYRLLDYHLNKQDITRESGDTAVREIIFKFLRDNNVYKEEE